MKLVTVIMIISIVFLTKSMPQNGDFYKPFSGGEDEGWVFMLPSDMSRV